MSNVSKLRLSCTVAVLGVSGGLFFFLPLPHHVKASFILSPQNPDRIWVKIPGVLENLPVQDGDSVNKGDTLAQLYNPDKEREREELLRKAGQSRVLEQAYQNLNRLDDAEKARVQAVQFENLVKKLDEEIGRLTLKAPRAGTVMQPPKPEQEGSALQAGSLFCQVGDPRHVEAWLVIDQGDVTWVKQNQRVQLLPYSHALKDVEGTIREIPNVNVEDLPPELEIGRAHV